MAIDPNRAALVSQEFRYVTIEDQAIKTRYPQSREITLFTQLNAAQAGALAQEIADDNDTLSRVYEVEVETILSLDDLVGAPPVFTLNDPNFSTDSRTMKLVGVEIDYQKGVTAFTVRG